MAGFKKIVEALKSPAKVAKEAAVAKYEDEKSFAKRHPILTALGFSSLIAGGYGGHSLGSAVEDTLGKQSASSKQNSPLTNPNFEKIPVKSAASTQPASETPAERTKRLEAILAKEKAGMTTHPVVADNPGAGRTGQKGHAFTDNPTIGSTEVTPPPGPQWEWKKPSTWAPAASHAVSTTWDDTTSPNSWSPSTITTVAGLAIGLLGRNKILKDTKLRESAIKKELTVTKTPNATSENGGVNTRPPTGEFNNHNQETSGLITDPKAVKSTLSSIQRERQNAQKHDTSGPT